MNIAAALSEIDVRDTAGETVRLGSLWAERPLALVFVRHYG